MKPHKGLLLLLMALVSGQPFSVMAQEVASAQLPLDFNRDIRPILSENCFYCHGQDSNKRLADLRLDDRDAVITTGAIVPGDASASGLIQRVHSENPDEQMPPPKSNRHLSPEQKALLQRWISEGAVYQKHWAFVAPGRPTDPEVTRQDWSRNSIDRFVLAKALEVSKTAVALQKDRRDNKNAPQKIKSKKRRRALAKKARASRKTNR